ncbi:cyanophycin synthetase [Acidovorax sp. NCPPB 3859]|nr:MULTISPECIES: cyanophycin synthetase [unclassified Acidovorax]MDA8448270.1 cyanophycin synthetase [Acidovorax sp. GBBC 3297]MDA8457763.1 cyanophycin synthetase [Acidovorax sp. GBBC 3333]MDA8462713.1 cyanophycin synthetase [Acidovorax sp. GBBC 3332]MDA8467833.1 cyanophycin synthetase [Acidovorax sp. GBBC 3299]WCM77852.1 cyanophycin synthetase [Acidovorax sp. GBBC 712]
MATFNDIQLLRITYLRGPSVWTYRPILEVWLDLGELEDWPSDKIPGLNERLTTWLPALIEHHCGVGERGGFIQRLEGGTWMGHVLEHVVIELLNLAGMPAEFGQTREVSRRGVYRMVFRCPEEDVARTALSWGHQLLMAAINDRPFDVKPAIQAIKTSINDSYLGPSTGSIVDAAGERRIPHIRLNDGNLVQLGYGAAQRRIWTAETDQTSAIAEGIAQDKDFTKRLLATCGVPVPEGRVVANAQEAWDVAQDIGFPVTVKPSDGNHARGVTLELYGEDEIKAAFALAEPEGSAVIVERFIEGTEHRLLVVGGKVVAACRGEMVSVSGNGRSTLRELVDVVNQDPRRGPEQEYPLDWIKLEAPAVQLELQRQGVTPETVPAQGQNILLQRNGNMAIDCTDEVHPDVAYYAQLAARIVGLDIAGMDMILQDVSRPMKEQGGAILEVNAGPGLLMHLKPTSGTPRPVGMAIVDHLFPRTEEGTGAGRIPLVGIAGTQGNAFIARLVGWLLQLSGKLTGVASSEGMFLANRRTQKTDTANWAGAHRLLTNRLAEAAVVQTTARSILEEGLAYDRCLVGVVTDMQGWEQVSDHDVLEPAQMTRVMRTQIDLVLDEGAGVLNADDAQVADLARLCDGEVLFYALNADNPVVAAHRAEGDGRAVFVQGGNVVLATGTKERVLGTLASLGLAGGVQPDTAALLASVATAWALDITPDLIAAGIKTFEYTH